MIERAGIFPPFLFVCVTPANLLPAESGLLLKMKIIFNKPFGQKFCRRIHGGQKHDIEISFLFIWTIYSRCKEDAQPME
jgi:hypothetical protein